MKIARLLLALAAAQLALASAAFGQGSLPTRGVLVGGISLGGVRLGDSPEAVELAWGTGHTSCAGCRLRTWLFVYPDRPVGAAVVFDRTERAVAVFTLGQPAGWRTQKGLWLGNEIHALTAKYDAPNMDYQACIGFSALSSRRAGVVTSIYTQAETVYGFAITAPGQPVCQ
jgi:hypothetical protein